MSDTEPDLKKENGFTEGLSQLSARTTLEQATFEQMLEHPDCPRVSSLPESLYDLSQYQLSADSELATMVSHSYSVQYLSLQPPRQRLRLRI